MGYYPWHGQGHWRKRKKVWDSTATDDQKAFAEKRAQEFCDVIISKGYHFYKYFGLYFWWQGVAHDDFTSVQRTAILESINSAKELEYIIRHKAGFTEEDWPYRQMICELMLPKLHARSIELSPVLDSEMRLYERRSREWHLVWCRGSLQDRLYHEKDRWTPKGVILRYDWQTNKD